MQRSPAADRNFVFRNLVDLSSHNANPPGVFEGEQVPLPNVADTRIAESVAAFRRFVAEHGSLQDHRQLDGGRHAAIGEDDPPTVRQLSWGHPTGRLVLGLMYTS